MWRKDCTVRRPDIESLRQRTCIQPAGVFLACTGSAHFCEQRPLQVCLVRVTGRGIQAATAMEVTVDSVLIEDGRHLRQYAVDAGLNGPAALAIESAEKRRLSFEGGHQPAAIAPGGTETTVLRLQQAYVQCGVLRLEIVGRPQAGETASDNGHIGLEQLALGRLELAVAAQGHAVITASDNGHIGTNVPRQGGTVADPARLQQPQAAIAGGHELLRGGRGHRRHGAAGQEQRQPEGDQADAAGQQAATAGALQQPATDPPAKAPRNWQVAKTPSAVPLPPGNTTLLTSDGRVASR